MSTIPQPETQSRQERGTINLRALAHQMERLAEVEERITGNPPDPEFVRQAKVTAAGIFRIVVMGEIKKGKSSFINALTGTENLVPVHSNVATSTVFKIHYGPEVRYTVYFEKDSGREKQVIPAGEVNDYGTEAGNPDNHKRVEYIRVESPAPILQNGLVIVDTPGVGGLFRKHREITFRHAPDADAVFFITESDRAPIGGEEVLFLKELRRITPHITFVQTKATKADADARISRMTNNVKIIREDVGLTDEEIQYFIVDSNLKMLADGRKQIKLLDRSGFIPLMAFLNNTLRKRQQLHVARTAIRRSMARLLPLAQTLEGRKKLLAADTAEKQQALAGENDSARKLFLDWKRDSEPRLLEEFRKGMIILSQNAIDQLSPLQPLGPVCSRFSQELRDSPTVEHLKQLLGQVRSDLAALASHVCLEIGETMKAKAATLIESLTRDIAISMIESFKLQFGESTAKDLFVNTDILDILIDKDEVGVDVKTVARSGMTGYAVGATIGGILGSVVPILGTAHGAFLGAAVAGWWMYSDMEDTEKRDLNTLKNQACAALQQSISTAYNSSTKHVSRVTAEIQSEATSAIQRILKSVQADIEAKQAEVAQRQKSTSEEIQAGGKKLTEQKQALESIRKQLAGFQQAVSAP
jgi:hypothetical protein